MIFDEKNDVSPIGIVDILVVAFLVYQALMVVRGRMVREFPERPWNEKDAIAAAEGLVA